MRTALLEVLIGSSAGFEISLGGDETLRSAPWIRKIEAFHIGQVSNTPKGVAVIAQAILQKSFLVLMDSEGTVYRTIPLQSLSKNVNGTVIEPLDLPAIDFTKSFVKMAEGTTIPVGSAFLFSVTYEKA